MPDSYQTAPREPNSRRPRSAWTRTVNFIHQVFDWVGRHELHVLLGMLVAVLSVWIFVKIAAEVMAGDTQKFDEWAVRALRRSDDITKSGHSYHADGCRYLSKSKIPISLSEAKEKYTPCPICHPPE